MHHLFLLLSSLCPLYIIAQKTLPTFDGIVSDKEWVNAEKFKINYEIEPGNNEASTHETEVFITYSKTDLYVGFGAINKFLVFLPIKGELPLQFSKLLFAGLRSI